MAMSMYPDDKEIEVAGTIIKFPGLDENKKFSNGDFNNPEKPASFIPAETINLLLDNLSEVIKAGKKEDEETPSDLPNNKDTNQVFNAIAELIRRPVDKEIKDRTTADTTLQDNINLINNNLIKNIRNIAYPIGTWYPQICEDNGTFDSNKSPAVLFGGTWSIKRNTQGVTLRTEGGKADEGGRDGNGIQQCAIENIWGRLSRSTTAGLTTASGATEGAFFKDGLIGTIGLADISNAGYMVAFDASRIVKTGTETRMINTKMILYVKVGNVN